MKRDFGFRTGRGLNKQGGKVMKQVNTLVMAFLLIAFASGFEPTYGQVQICTGKPVEVFADPNNDIVVKLDINGHCNSPFFHIQRSNGIYRELTAMVLMAVST